MHDLKRPPMIVEEGVVVARRPTGTAGGHLLDVASPEIARRAAPGQFVMVRLLNRAFPYLGRPLSFADVDPGRPEVFRLVFTAGGEGTRRLAAAQPGDAIRSVGPLGNPFAVAPAREHLFIAGGIGVAPFPFLAREIARLDPGAERVLLLGAGDRSGLHLAGGLRESGVTVEVATLDGSAGFQGTVVDLLEVRGHGASSRLYACGPNPMLAALARALAPHDRPCQAALEGRMACGFGACNACVVPVRDPGEAGWHHELVCLQGPVFELSRVGWEPEPGGPIEARASVDS